MRVSIGLFGLANRQFPAAQLRKIEESATQAARAEQALWPDLRAVHAVRKVLAEEGGCVSTSGVCHHSK
jgi:hypothetical protein